MLSAARRLSFRPVNVVNRILPIRLNSTITSTHPKLAKDALLSVSQEKENLLNSKDYVLFHPVYSKSDLEAATYTHREVSGIKDRIAFGLVRTMRYVFDTATPNVMSERQWLNRICFLETVAGVPGMVAAMLRHTRSLRLLKRDNGWIHTLLEEAENERMHLLTFMKMKEPGLMFRAMVLVTQGVFFNAYLACYLLSPQTCHRFVGYLEESAVHTYTLCLKDIEQGKIRHWGTQPAPEIARFYWQLSENATVKDVVAAVRADEADHRDTNHALAELQVDDVNPKAYS
ncbi:alternative oxidase [Rhizoclosmatium globosum]|uniref:Alternative oxidase n=1 Tax=Rhizoclosmatium globosum TaxID=329046 RepID=A0A1Y2CSC8_9FUNG|nr:alternative oxidase [Rhizoclosmatium globosum]|eukprot:ORY49764.1 alternative oxidase [Rhizoclosmatium globosum]